jgi:dTMP kinase
LEISEAAYWGMWRLKKAAIQNGNLVVISGFDGAGKTTQIELLAKSLTTSGENVISTRQPTDWYRSHPQLRAYIEEGQAVDQQFLALLAAADRRKHIVEVIDPNMTAGSWVLCDRYVFSSLAFFAERGVDADIVARFNLDIPRPSLAVLLDVPPNITVDRINHRDGGVRKFEEQDAARIGRIRNNFLRLAALDPEVLVIDGRNEPASIHKIIMDRLNKPKQMAS